ncbi:hypothetical protein [Halorussus salinisoli]|uniref:hypothetical protein n=1 Tax=Halorussus salinisoli TaxID=2558242 RepID=UPI0010C1D28D|nr:hypothetical protein [Halorussus salinisoli]
MVEGNQHTTATETETKFTNVRAAHPESDVGRLRELWRIMFGGWRMADQTIVSYLRESEYSWDYVDDYIRTEYENKEGETFTVFDRRLTHRVNEDEVEMA